MNSAAWHATDPAHSGIVPRHSVGCVIAGPHQYMLIRVWLQLLDELVEAVVAAQIRLHIPILLGTIDPPMVLLDPGQQVLEALQSDNVLPLLGLLGA